jgi:hypothetical protein
VFEFEHILKSCVHGYKPIALSCGPPAFWVHQRMSNGRGHSQSQGSAFCIACIRLYIKSFLPHLCCTQSLLSRLLLETCYSFDELVRAVDAKYSCNSRPPASISCNITRVKHKITLVALGSHIIL